MSMTKLTFLNSMLSNKTNSHRNHSHHRCSIERSSNPNHNLKKSRNSNFHKILPGISVRSLISIAVRKALGLTGVCPSKFRIRNIPGSKG